MFMLGIGVPFIAFHGASWRLVFLTAFNIWVPVLFGRHNITPTFICEKDITFVESVQESPCRERRYFQVLIKMICIKSGIF